MKRVAILLFAFIYLIPAVGFSIDLHWCGKKVKMVTVSSQHEKKCTCSKKMASRCCKDVHLSVKITDHQMPASNYVTPEISWIKLLASSVLASSLSLPSASVSIANFSVSHAPPYPGGTAVYLSHCNFRI